MSESNWANEHMTAAALGGLTTEESVRFDVNADAMTKTAADELRAVDASLRELFAPLAPGSVEVASVARLRQDWTRSTVERGWQRKLAYGLAASVGLGLTGAGVSMLGGLPMPGMVRDAARLDRESERVSSAIAASGERRESGADGWVDSLQHAKKNNTWMYNGVAPLAEDAGLKSNPPALVRPDELAKQWGMDDLAERSRKLVVPQTSTPDFDSLRAIVPPGGSPDGGALPNLKLNSEPNLYFLQAGDGREAASKKYLNDDAVRYKDVADKSREALLGSADYGYIDLPKANPAGKDDRPQLRGMVTTFDAPTATVDPEREKPAKNEQDSRSMTRNGRFDPRTGVPVTGTEQELVAAIILAPQVPGGPGTPPTVSPQTPPAAARKIIIRSGDIEFEVESFDGSVAAVTKLVLGINGAFIATVNSEKMANGKVKGSVVVRVPPEHLDALVLDLRRDLGKGGELKGQKIGSQDITKQYTDLESRLRAARTMETRLLEIIKTGKGEIKQLLEAEKELGVWRTKIEEIEGELRYFGNLASLSTLTISMTEKEIRTAASLTESERIAAGVEVEDVEKAYRALQAVVTEFKGRISKAELKQHSFGQSAAIVFEVAPESVGPVRDRLRQIGEVARLSSERHQTSDGQPVPRDAKVKRGDTVFDVQLYNLNNVRPRETATMQVAVPKVSDVYVKIREAVSKAGGRILNANLNEQDKKNVTATLDFDIKRADEGAVRSLFESSGEVVSRVITRSPEVDLVTDAKVAYRTTLVSTERIAPRERVVLGSEVSDVDGAIAVLSQYVTAVNGTQIDETSDRKQGRVTTKVVYQVPLAAAAGLTEKVKAAGILRFSNSTRDTNAPDGKFALARFEVTLSNEERIVAPEDGLWPQIRKGLSYSVSVLLTSVTWVVFGLCVVLPWAIVGYGGYRLVKRMTRGTPAVPAT